MADAREIGFNDDVRCGKRRFHVQTEVVGRTETKIRTTVLEGGAVTYVESSDCPAVGDDVELAKNAAGAQHASVMRRVASGEIG